MRMKHGRADITTICAYFPPKPQLNTEKKHYWRTASALADWVRGVVQSMRTSARRSLLVVGGDFNDYIDKHDPDDGKSAANVIKQILRDYDMAAVNSIRDGGPTYFGNSHTSRIDYTCLPLEQQHRVTVCRADMQMGRLLQMVTMKKPFDHYPPLDRHGLLARIRQRAWQARNEVES